MVTDPVEALLSGELDFSYNLRIFRGYYGIFKKLFERFAPHRDGASHMLLPERFCVNLEELYDMLSHLAIIPRLLSKREVGYCYHAATSKLTLNDLTLTAASKSRPGSTRASTASFDQLNEDDDDDEPPVSRAQREKKSVKRDPNLPLTLAEFEICLIYIAVQMGQNTQENGNDASIISLSLSLSFCQSFSLCSCTADTASLCLSVSLSL